MDARFETEVSNHVNAVKRNVHNWSFAHGFCHAAFAYMYAFRDCASVKRTGVIELLMQISSTCPHSEYKVFAIFITIQYRKKFQALITPEGRLLLCRCIFNCLSQTSRLSKEPTLLLCRLVDDVGQDAALRPIAMELNAIEVFSDVIKAHASDAAIVSVCIDAIRSLNEPLKDGAGSDALDFRAEPADGLDALVIAACEELGALNADSTASGGEAKKRKIDTVEARS